MFHSIATCWPLSVLWDSVSINFLQNEKHPQNVIAMYVGKGLYTLHAGKQGGRYKTNFIKSKTSSRFPNFDASNAWQMGHNSQEGFFLVKNRSWTLLPGLI